MTSLSEYYPGRKVYRVKYQNDDMTIKVIRKAKKGILCACSDGVQRVYKPTSEIEVYPRD